MRTLLSRLLSLVRRRAIERDLDDEIGAHLAMQEAEFRATGMTPEAARAAAAALRAQCRDVAALTNR